MSNLGKILPVTQGKFGKELVQELISHRPEIPNYDNDETGISWELEDFEWMFANTPNKVVLNELPFISKEDQKEVQKRVFKITHGNTLESYPSCECGETKYVENLTSYTGVNCNKCGTAVVYQYEKKLEPILWLGVPDGVDAFIVPDIWYMLENVTRGSNYKTAGKRFSMLRWLTNPLYRNYSGGERYLAQLETLYQEGMFERDYNYFVRNIDKMLDIIGDVLASSTPQKIQNFLEVKLVIKMYRDRVFTKYLPLPNSVCAVFEQHNFNFKRMTGSASLLMPALNHLLGLTRTPEGSKRESELTPRELKRNCKETATFTVDYQIYWDYIIREEIGRKPGIARKDTFGVRPPFTFRAVITSIVGPHAYDEIHIPWTIGCELFRPFIHEELLREGMGPVQIESFINRHMRIYHERLDLIFQKIIAEWRTIGFSGWPTSLVRNPSLYVGSNQTQFITKVTTDPKDKTCKLSWVCCYAYNGDFDGEVNDCRQVSLILLLGIRLTLNFLNCWNISLSSTTTGRE